MKLMQFHQHRTFVKLYGCSLIDAVGDPIFSTHCVDTVYLFTCFPHHLFFSFFMQLCIQPKLRLCQSAVKVNTGTIHILNYQTEIFVISSFCHKFRVEEIIY